MNIISVCPHTQWAILVKPDQPLTLHFLTAEPLLAGPEPDLVTAPLHDLFSAPFSGVTGANCDVLSPKELGDEATPFVWDSKVTRWTALVGTGDNWSSKALLFCWEKAIDDEAEWFVSFDITLAYSTGCLSPPHTSTWKEVDTAFELTVAVFARPTTLALGHYRVGAEWAWAQDSTTVHFPQGCGAVGQ